MLLAAQLLYICDCIVTANEVFYAVEDIDRGAGIFTLFSQKGEERF